MSNAYQNSPVAQRTRPLLPLLGALWLAACHLIAVGQVEEAGCEERGHTLLPVPAASQGAWEGPFLATRSAEDFLAPDSCPATLTESERLLGRGFDEEKAMAFDCGCAVSGDACRLGLRIHDNPNVTDCNETDHEVDRLPAEGCITIDAQPDWDASIESPPVNARCEPRFEPEKPPFQTSIRLCTPLAANDDPDEGLCIETAPGGFETCVLHVGEVACPTNTPYQRRDVFYEDFDDGRECICGEADGTECDGVVGLYAELSDCINNPDLVALQVTTKKYCHAIDQPLKAARLREIDSAPACGPTTLEGSVREVGAVTVCCSGP